MPAQYTGALGVLQDWQDLAGAMASTFVAAAAIFISVSALRAAKDQVKLGRDQLDLMRRHEEERREARINAMRAALNPTLSSLCAWAEAVSDALRDLPVRNPIPKTARDKFAPPKVSETDLSLIVNVIEAADDEAVRARLNRLISNIQVLTSRLTLISKVRSGSSVMASEVDTYLLDAAIVYAQATSCFGYARRRVDTVAPLTWKNVDTAMMSLSFHGPRFNTLIERIVGKKAAHPDPERLYED
ncbi:hypothetical protein [uncultured Phenylobacterium sp.]|uniref:hypothetical protein n=1 Tax=uncultured Phenylobacterium sp. TaxID=349273 RepID=UPI0025E33315|nr:hypothetical protein [uncultured Phenylobacterium sp.]